MKFTNLARTAQSFANSPQGRKMIGQATDAVRRRRRGQGSGAGRSSGLNSVLDAARRFTTGRGGHPGDPGRDSGPQPPRH